MTGTAGPAASERAPFGRTAPARVPSGRTAPARAPSGLVVVKVGGGLARASGPDALRASLAAITAAADGRRAVLVVPGGGAFADAVRAADAAYALGDDTAHAMALLAMDQFGLALARLLGDAPTTTDPAPWTGGGVRVLLPAAAASAATAAGDLPATWAVTADSIAAWAAAQAGAERLVLVKPVGGLVDPWPGGALVAELDLDALAALQRAGAGAVVDAWFPTAAGRFGAETWLVDGHHPSRLRKLISGEPAEGTRLTAR